MITQKVLSGRVASGAGVASARNRGIWPILINQVPPLKGYLPGTLNIRLQEDFPTPSKRVFRIPPEVIPAVPGFPSEGFTFFPIDAINDASLDALAYRPDATCHGGDILEIMAPVNLRDTLDLRDDQQVTITLTLEAS